MDGTVGEGLVTHSFLSPIRAKFNPLNLSMYFNLPFFKNYLFLILFIFLLYITLINLKYNSKSEKKIKKYKIL